MEDCNENSSGCVGRLGLTPFQRRIVSCGLTSVCACLIGASFWIGYLVMGKVVNILSPVIVPVLLGLLISFVLRPLYNKTNFWFSLLVVLFFSMAAALLIYKFMAPQIVAFIGSWPNLIKEVQESLPKNLREWFASIDAKPWVSRYGMACVTEPIRYVSMLLGFIVNLSFALFFSYWFLEHPVNADKLPDNLEQMANALKEWVRAFKNDWKKTLGMALRTFLDIMTSYVPRQILINLIEGCLGSLGLGFALKVPGGYVFGFLLGFLNIIPFFGTFAMLPIVLPLAYWAHKCVGFEAAYHGVWNVVFVLIVWVCIQFIDQFLPARVHGEKMRLSAWQVVVSFLFWGAVLDPVWGLVLALPLTAFFKGAFDSVHSYNLISKTK